MSNDNKENFFLPYQLRWLNDNSKIKIWEKSRRIGATYVQSYEDVWDCVNNNVPSVWFSSADESAAKEYIDYCKKWVNLFHIAAKDLGEMIIDSEKDIKALVIEFSNGTKIHALSSNPNAFRSKGGKVVLDEFAHHKNPFLMWRAAKPCVTWGFPLRILSTHNGQSCLFFRFISQILKGILKWSLHTTSIQLAAAEGLVDKIFDRKTTKAERDEWMEEQRRDCFDEYTWLQEYCCIAVDEACAFLPYELIAACEMDDILKPLNEIENDLFVGVDVGRTKDLTVIWCLEGFENTAFTRHIIALKNTPFHIQEEILFSVLSHKKFRRCCPDASGIGKQLAENAQRRFGQYRVEPIVFTNRIKEALAYNLRTNFENKRVFIPNEHEIREDLHSVRRMTTIAGNIRFDAEHSENGHADRFWALALALNAFNNNTGDINIASRKKYKMRNITESF